MLFTIFSTLYDFESFPAALLWDAIYLIGARMRRDLHSENACKLQSFVLICMLFSTW